MLTQSQSHQENRARRRLAEGTPRRRGASGGQQQGRRNSETQRQSISGREAGQEGSRVRGFFLLPCTQELTWTVQNVWKHLCVEGQPCPWASVFLAKAPPGLREGLPPRTRCQRSCPASQRHKHRSLGFMQI